MGAGGSRGCGRAARTFAELVHDGCPVVCVEDAPFVYVNVFAAHVNVGFFHGDALGIHSDCWKGNGRFMRHVKPSQGVLSDESSLQALIRHCPFGHQGTAEAELRDEPRDGRTPVAFRDVADRLWRLYVSG